MTELFLMVESRSETEAHLGGWEETHQYYRRADGTGEEFKWNALPAGAVLIGKDGLPRIYIWANKEKTEVFGFNPQSPAGARWQVTGTAPKLTCHPSVFVSPPNGWHGFIRDGFLVDA